VWAWDWKGEEASLCLDVVFRGGQDQQPLAGQHVRQRAFCDPRWRSVLKAADFKAANFKAAENRH